MQPVEIEVLVFSDDRLRFLGKLKHALFLKTGIDGRVVRIEAAREHLGAAMVAIARFDDHAVEKEPVHVVGADFAQHAEMVVPVLRIVVAKRAEEILRPVAADDPALRIEPQPAHMTRRLLVVQSDIDVGCHADIARMAFAQQITEHVSLHAGIGQADFCRVVGEAQVAAGKGVDVRDMRVLEPLREDSGVPFAVEIVNPGHGMEINVDSSLHRSHNRHLFLFVEPFRQTGQSKR